MKVCTPYNLNNSSMFDNGWQGKLKVWRGLDSFPRWRNIMRECLIVERMMLLFDSLFFIVTGWLKSTLILRRCKFYFFKMESWAELFIFFEFFFHVPEYFWLLEWQFTNYFSISSQSRFIKFVIKILLQSIVKNCIDNITIIEDFFSEINSFLFKYIQKIGINNLFNFLFIPYSKDPKSWSPRYFLIHPILYSYFNSRTISITVKWKKKKKIINSTIKQHRFNRQAILFSFSRVHYPRPSQD